MTIINFASQPKIKTQFGNNPQRESWRSDAFINIFVPKANGNRGKLGTLPLKLSTPAQSAVINHLREDSSRAKAMMAKFVIEFVPGNVTVDDVALALPGMEKPAPVTSGENAADGYINFHAVRGDESTVRIGSISLRGNNPTQAQVLNYLYEDPSRVVELVAICDIEFNMVDANNDSGADLIL